MRPAAGGTSAASPAPATPTASSPAPVRAPESSEDPARAAVRLAAAVRLPPDLTLRNLNGKPGGGLRFDFWKNEKEGNPDAAVVFTASVSLTGPSGKGFLEVTVGGARPAGYPKVGDLCDDEAAAALRPDGTRASVTTTNLLGDSAERPGRITHQLSVQQLTAIVLDPALSYYP